MTADFGIDENLGTIGDFVWLDTDGDGIQDAGEVGIAGVTIYVIDPSTGDTIATAITDATGHYLVNVEPGTYTVVVVPIDGYDNTTPTTWTATVTPDGYDLDNDFGFILPAGQYSLGNYVWNDTNGNGSQDGGEQGVSGVSVALMNPGPDGVVGTSDDSFIAFSQ